MEGIRPGSDQRGVTCTMLNEVNTQASYALTVMLAVVGALFALFAELGKRYRFLTERSARWLYRLSYLFMALSIFVFVIRGLAR